MDLTRQIDGYCERTDFAFWAEPINAITNGAFLIAALVGLLAAWRTGKLDGPAIWLIGVITVIGTGSFLFHTYATVWAAIADTSPIMLFILSYFTVVMNRFAGFSWAKSLLLTVGFLGVLVGLSFVANTLLRDVIGGSVSYVPALVSLFAVGCWLAAYQHEAGKWLIIASAIFSLSLTFRALDEPLCAVFPMGTHWLWHILNGVVLGSLTLAVIRHGERPEP